MVFNTKVEHRAKRDTLLINLCAPGGIRTHNLLLRRQLLYPLSYRGMHTREAQRTGFEMSLRRTNLMTSKINCKLREPSYLPGSLRGVL